MHRLGNLPSPTSVEFISWAHRAFYEEMPVEFRFVERPDGPKAEIVPGVLRTAPDEDVMVGRHRPPEPDRVAAFLEHFARRFVTAAKSARTRRSDARVEGKSGSVSVGLGGRGIYTKHMNI